jgi:hypothetical protein
MLTNEGFSYFSAAEMADPPSFMAESGGFTPSNFTTNTKISPQ